MELSMSGGSLRTFARCVTCLARVGSELVLQAHPAKLELHTLNSSRSAYASVSLARGFFDQFHHSPGSSGPAASAPSSTPLQCSVLLKSVLSVLRTPPAALDHVAVSLPHPDAPKLQITLHCLNGMRKTYWIACNAEAEVQTLALDRGRFPSHLAIRPRDLARLLSNFQISLQELTVIATEPAAGLPDAGGDVGGKAVELRSYNDPTKDDCDTRLHTQLWIDPAEEFVEYVHTGDPVDVTFGAFLTFCEGCEVDILLLFEKAGEPVLLVPRFGSDDGSSSDFDATLVLATMLVSQLTDNNVAQQPATSAQHAEEPRAAATPSPVPENFSNHTKIWSELSGSAPKSFEANREIHAQKERNASASLLNHTSMLPRVINAPCKPPVADYAKNIMQPLQMDHLEEHPEVISATTRSQHHPSNWVGADDNDDDNEEDEELLVQTTPHYMD
ncbi:uncharacterized protein LOC133912496 isoform X2 [Phragmites australis]|uniref:uncharacterized protein LOC133912496 isoform X2 n=1 Tax=Phragmites australis TaxID=29695 RepID=UPI002D76B081|nr:uncharacterized protein LOC133912496 isoform X2 [Phragmites australis]